MKTKEILEAEKEEKELKRIALKKRELYYDLMDDLENYIDSYASEYGLPYEEKEKLINRILIETAQKY